MTSQLHSLPVLRPQPKTALVLAGGGVTGAVYELGALRALDEVLAPTGRTTNDFDIYVGTSAGAIVCSLLANGLSTGTLCQLLADQHPAQRGLRRADVFKWNTAGLGRWALDLPGRLARASHSSLRQRSLTPLMLALSEAEPPGLYDSQALARYLCQVYTTFGGTDRFDALHRELYLVATSLTSGQRAVFGRGHDQRAAISQAVAASTALPFVYAPVGIGGEWFVDGGLRGNASVDVAVEQGAQLVIIINPVVPTAPDMRQAKAAPDVTGQALRIASHAGLHYHLKHLRRVHPEVDFVVIEPRADDAEFLSVPMMDFGARQRVLDHGCAAVRQHLADHHAYLAAVLARHGLRLSAPPGQPQGDHIGAAGIGSTTAAQPEPTGTLAWPSQARPGHTGAHAPAPRRPEPALPGLGLRPKGDTRRA